MKRDEKMNYYRNKWQAAYEGAAFYSSEQNTTEYWDSAAQNGGAGLSGNEHIELLYSALNEDN